MIVLQVLYVWTVLYSLCQFFINIRDYHISVWPLKIIFSFIPVLNWVMIFDTINSCRKL